MSAVSQLVLLGDADLRAQLLPHASKLVWVLCSSGRAALAEPLLDALAVLAPSSAASRQCVVDVAALSTRRADALPAALRLLAPAVAAVELPTTLPASLATTFAQLPAPSSELLRHVCRSAAGAETLRACVAEYVRREHYSAAAAWRALEVLSCAANDDDSKAAPAAIATLIRDLVKGLPADADADDRCVDCCTHPVRGLTLLCSDVTPKMTRGAAEQLLAECTA